MRLNLNLFSIFQITVVTTGWISLAFTFRGNPIGSDIIVGWVGESSEAALIVSATFNFSTQMAEKLANKYLKKKITEACEKNFLLLYCTYETKS